MFWQTLEKINSDFPTTFFLNWSELKGYIPLIRTWLRWPLRSKIMFRTWCISSFYKDILMKNLPKVLKQTYFLVYKHYWEMYFPLCKTNLTFCWDFSFFWIEISALTRYYDVLTKGSFQLESCFEFGAIYEYRGIKVGVDIFYFCIDIKQAKLHGIAHFTLNCYYF